MTPDKLKKAIRERQAKTGESYTTARRQVLIDAGYEPDNCPSCRKGLVKRGALLCLECGIEKAGFDHSPDYWDPD